jgi:hypothetical protein
VLSFVFIFYSRYKLQCVKFCYKRIYGVYATTIVSMLRDKLYSAFEEYFQSTISNIGNVVETTFSSGGMCSGRYDRGDDLSGFNTFESELFGSMSSKSQLSLYLEESRHDHRNHGDLDVLGYWKSQYSRLPKLSLMARDILSIPITSVALESAFSVGG